MSLSNDKLKDLCGRFGAPFFLYDLDGLKDHMSRVKSILHPEIKVWYACKANPLRAVLETLNGIGIGVDVASLGELAQGLAAGINPSGLIATGPAKSRSYLRSLMEAQVSVIIIESINQLIDLESVASELGRKQDVLLRVQLDWPDEAKSVLGGSAITPFGLGLLDWEEVRLQEYTHLNIRGIHCFQWGNVLDIEKLKLVWASTISSCKQLAARLKIPLEIIDLGGGLGVPYNGGAELDFAEVHALLLELKHTHELHQVWLELGRFTVANFGSYFTPVIDVKSVRGKNIVVTEGGINHIARPALVNEAFPGQVLSKQSKKSLFSIHGPLCTALDHLGDLELAADVAPGDWIRFDKVGAYGFTESMPYFLCHGEAGEAYLKGGVVSIARESGGLAWMR